MINTFFLVCDEHVILLFNIYWKAEARRQLFQGGHGAE